MEAALFEGGFLFFGEKVGNKSRNVNIVRVKKSENISDIVLAKGFMDDMSKG